MRKFNVLLHERIYRQLVALSEYLELPMTDVIREAVLLMWCLVRELRAGNKVLLHRLSGQVVEPMFFNLIDEGTE